MTPLNPAESQFARRSRLLFGRSRDSTTTVDRERNLSLPTKNAVTAEDLARSAADYSKSTKQLSGEIAEHLSLVPKERKRCQDILRGMCAAQRHLCRRIRQALLMGASRAECHQFPRWTVHVIDIHLLNCVDVCY